MHFLTTNHRKMGHPRYFWGRQNSSTMLFLGPTFFGIPYFFTLAKTLMDIEICQLHYIFVPTKVFGQAVFPSWLRPYSKTLG